MKDFKKFSYVLAGLAETYERELSQSLTELYWNVLKRYSDNEFEAGVERMLKDRTLQKFPKPAEIIKYIEGNGLTPEERAEIAWQLVVKAMSEIGSAQSVIFEDKTVMGVIEAIGGWSDLCIVETDQLVWKQKEFVKLYCIDKKAGIDRGVDKLVGRYETINSTRNFKVEPPYFIGENGKQIKQLGAKNEKDNMVCTG